jgi:hypothetical protein
MSHRPSPVYSAQTRNDTKEKVIRLRVLGVFRGGTCDNADLAHKLRAWQKTGA